MFSTTRGVGAMGSSTNGYGGTGVEEEIASMAVVESTKRKEEELERGVLGAFN